MCDDPEQHQPKRGGGAALATLAPSQSVKQPAKKPNRARLVGIALVAAALLVVTEVVVVETVAAECAVRVAVVVAAICRR